jgi:hypothetical protein
MFSASHGFRSRRPHRRVGGVIRPRVPAVAGIAMSRIRWAVLGVAAALLTGCLGSSPPAAVGHVDPLEGAWEVTWVLRDGEPDPLPVGGRMTFAGGEVTFQAKAVRSVDWAS